jgi:ubiquinone/menaquinone biosynthesis C-methylase UbiE
MMRVISGGVDYAAGVERGLSFGLQEVLGIEVDMDLAGQDAIEHRLAFIEDSRRDFAKIEIPITWYHGKHDAWMDLERVRDVMAHGKRGNRKLVEIPTGHQLNSSRQALEVFSEIAVEVGKVGCGVSLKHQIVDLDDLGRRYAAERARKPTPTAHDLREFWRSYLLGRDDESLGIELMHGTSAYRDLMDVQVAALDLHGGELVADLGCGPGRFAIEAAGAAKPPCHIHGFDYVRDGLLRGSALAQAHSVRARYVECDMGPGSSARIPARSHTYDAVVASLFLSYLGDPAGLLREIARVLKPGGRAVLSTLLRDADISNIYQQGVAELTAALARGGLEPKVAQRMDRSARTFLNDAARLLDYEEGGIFQFWEESELEELVSDAGLCVLDMRRTFGTPPQAIVLTARAES